MEKHTALFGFLAAPFRPSLPWFLISRKAYPRNELDLINFLWACLFLGKTFSCHVRSADYFSSPGVILFQLYRSICSCLRKRYFLWSQTDEFSWRGCLFTIFENCFLFENTTNTFNFQFFVQKNTENTDPGNELDLTFFLPVCFHGKNDQLDLMMGHGVGSYIGLNEIGSPSPMKTFITIN